MNRIAVLLTVYNRKEVTLKGLRSLNNAIVFLKNEHPEKDYCIDIYMTDDGCTDGTGEAVQKEFPNITIVAGDGSLYWGGGMRFAWQKAIDSGINYDFFLWFNDDIVLDASSLDMLFTSMHKASENAIICGAFCNSDGEISYGGKRNGKFIIPDGRLQEITFMNGNLVLIPFSIYESIGMIDKHYKHGEGDYDYGLRAREKGFNVFLSPYYVGTAERHDELIPKYCLSKYSLKKRWEILHLPIYSPFNHFYFNMRYNGMISAIISFCICYVGVLTPNLYGFLKRKINS